MGQVLFAYYLEFGLNGLFAAACVLENTLICCVLRSIHAQLDQCITRIARPGTRIYGSTLGSSEDPCFGIAICSFIIL